MNWLNIYQPRFQIALGFDSGLAQNWKSGSAGTMLAILEKRLQRDQWAEVLRRQAGSLDRS